MPSIPALLVGAVLASISGISLRDALHGYIRISNRVGTGIRKIRIEDTFSNHADRWRAALITLSAAFLAIGIALIITGIDPLLS